MKKIKLIIVWVFALLFAGLFLCVNSAKATVNNCSGTQESCGNAGCCNIGKCCNTGCCGADQYCYQDPNLGSRCVDINSGVGGAGAGAGVIGNPVAGSLNTQAGIPLLQKLITYAITIMFVVGAVIFFFMLLIGAIQWIASGGDKQAIEGAKAKISNAMIGLIILLSVFVIVKLIGTFLNVPLLNLTIPTL